SEAADRNTNALTIMLEPSPAKPLMNSNTASMSDPEVAHFVHDDIAEDHPGPSQREADLGEALIPDDGVEVGRHDIEQKEDRDRKAGQKQRREFSFRRERLDLAPHLEAPGNRAGRVLQNSAQVPPGRAQDRHGGDEQRQ